MNIEANASAHLLFLVLRTGTTIRESFETHPELAKRGKILRRTHQTAVDRCQRSLAKVLTRTAANGFKRLRGGLAGACFQPGPEEAPAVWGMTSYFMIELFVCYVSETKVVYVAWLVFQLLLYTFVSMFS